jgi:hypothetical protein
MRTFQAVWRRYVLIVLAGLVFEMVIVPTKQESYAAALARGATRGGNNGVNWLTDYADAFAKANRERRMLVINFVAQGEGEPYQREMDRWIDEDAAVQAKLEKFVLVRVPIDAEIEERGEQIRLLSHPAFQPLQGTPGIAMVDLRDSSQPFYGQVVTVLPMASGKYYRWQNSYLNAALDLPAGTLSQRTLVWAVRVHPETPASTIGAQHAVVAGAATEHSVYQARIGVQGHQQFETRAALLRTSAGAMEASEVVAESWPNEGIIDACIDCVASWRQSPGHWGAVRKRHRLFGYDIRRGRNGIWYATGLFAD